MWAWALMADSVVVRASMGRRMAAESMAMRVCSEVSRSPQRSVNEQDRTIASMRGSWKNTESTPSDRWLSAKWL